MSQRSCLLALALVLPACTVAQGGGEGGDPGADPASSPSPSGSSPAEVKDTPPGAEPWAFLNSSTDLFRGLKKADFSPIFKGGPGGSGPEGASLQIWDTPIKNQGSRGWCTAFAAVSAMENIVRHTFGETIDLSEIDHWDHYQEYNVYSSVSAAASKMIVPESSWPYWGSPIAGYRSTAVAKVSSYKNITTRSAVFDAIRAGHPVVIGTDLTHSWRTAGSDGRISSSGYTIGGHALTVVGFQDDSTWGGGGYLTIKNSWGTKWGDLGYAHVPYDYCQVNGCYFIEIQSVEYKGKVNPDPSPTPAPPPAPPTGEPTADDIDVEAEHDPASPDRFKLHLVERKTGALAQVASVTYDSHETFGSYQFVSVKDAGDGYATPFYFRTYARHWRTNGAVVRLSSGKSLDLAGAVIDW